MAEPAAGDDTGFLPLSRLQTQYSDYRTSKRAERDEGDEADRYYHADQWTSAEIATLNERKQPVITYNRIQRKIDGIVGLVERLRQDPKAYPRTPAHEDGAEIATNVLNFVLDQSRWKDVSPDIAREGAIGPLAGIELEIAAGDRGDPDIRLHTLDKRHVFYDPRSRKPDFSDARYMGVAKWVDLDLAQEMFPDFTDRLKDLATSGESAFGTGWDNEGHREHQSSNERSVFLVEHFYVKAGEWRYCFYAGDLVLSEGVSPFPHWEEGKNGPRYRLFSASIDHDGDRYGFIRNLKGPQDEINHRRSKGLHLLNTTRMTIEEGSGVDIDAVREERHRSDGVVVLPPGAKAQFESSDKQAAANLEMMNEAKTEIENFGPNPALIGQGVMAKSGRAIALLQQAGIAELGPFLIAYRAFKTQVYRAVWSLIQQNWTSERWIRVTDDEGLNNFLSVNKLGFDEYGQPTIANALGQLDVDLIVDEGPDQVNSMADAFDTLVALAQQGAQVPPELILELSSLPSSIKKMALAKLQQAQQPNPLAQQAQQIQLAGAAAEVGLTKAKTEESVAKARGTVAKAANDQDLTRLEGRALDLKGAQAANDLMNTLAGVEQDRASAPGLMDSGYTGAAPY